MLFLSSGRAKENIGSFNITKFPVSKAQYLVMPRVKSMRFCHGLFQKHKCLTYSKLQLSLVPVFYSLILNPKSFTTMQSGVIKLFFYQTGDKFLCYQSSQSFQKALSDNLI